MGQIWLSLSALGQLWYWQAYRLEYSAVFNGIWNMGQIGSNAASACVSFQFWQESASAVYAQ